MAAKWTDFVAGAVLTAAQLNDVLDNFQDIAIFNETQASGTNGGTFTSGSYVKRTLNTTVVNNITGCSIASSVITLPAGTYSVFASAPAYRVAAHKIKLRNTTASTDIAIGASCFTDASDASVVTHSVLQTRIVLSASTTIELQHRAGTTKADNGFGQPSTFGDTEIYSQITIARIA
jgi:hypothetical protein